MFSGGARLRPSLCISVAAACGHADAPGLDESAVALELLHCASLVHDDLPCFDDAELRRGRPTVHRAFGEPIAVLVGDALIAHAFDHAVCEQLPADKVRGVVRILGAAVGSARGLVAGQAWESEPFALLSTYHQAKTGALFEAAASLGAHLAGADADAWLEFGAAIGEAYQVADDLRDTLAAADLEKPAGQDALHGRPNAALELGTDGAVERLTSLLRSANERMPSCPRPEFLRRWLDAASARLCLGIEAQLARPRRSLESNDSPSVRTEAHAGLAGL